MIQNIDFTDDKEIGYTEFLAATVDPNILHDENKVKGVFNLFDVDNSGEITSDNMMEAFSKIGMDIFICIPKIGGNGYSN